LDYKKGTEVLPAHLLTEIQKYIEGSLVYIPKKSTRVGWGQASGARRIIDQRNQKIIRLFEQGDTITELSEKFHLGEETIKKIVYGRKQV
jgi:Mor family transcriptional regulator